MHPAAIGPFRIERELGRGGMGEVFLATDTRLDRQVAVKALPAHLAQDPDRLARFQREAKVLASLNHPGIGAIYGLEEANGHLYLILEYIQGETLADRLSKGPLPVDEALPLAVQVAAALEAAHEKGIIHRDLKPGNIMVAPDGTLKVLDFGLARTSEDAPPSSITPSLADSPTLTSPARFQHSPTIPGAILGTAGYMSPEQARGKHVDKRSDIFSFGCVLYEMLSGAPPFGGETVADAIGATLHKDSNLNLLPPNTPPRVRSLLENCLAKDRRNRLHDIGDARIELERAASGNDWVPAASTPAKPGRLLPRLVAGAAGAIALVALGAGLWSVLGSQPAAAPEVRCLALDLPAPLAVRGAGLTADGRAMTLLATPRAAKDDSARTTQLYRRPMDRYEYTPIPGTEGAVAWRLSRDGRTARFIAPLSSNAMGRRLAAVPVDGSAPPTTLFELNDSGFFTTTFAELPNGDLLVTDGAKSFVRIPKDGGAPSAPVTIDAGRTGVVGVALTMALPNNRLVLVGIATYGSRGYQASPGVMDIQTGKVTFLAEDGGWATYTTSGHLVFARGGTLMAAPFDADAGKVLSAPVAVWGGLPSEVQTVPSWFQIASDGTLVYASMSAERVDYGIKLLGADGVITPWSNELQWLNGMVASPDGQRMLFQHVNARNIDRLATTPVGHVDFVQLNAEPNADVIAGVWSPDSKQIAYVRVAKDDADGIYLQSADSGTPRRVFKPASADQPYVPTAWVPDGSALLVNLATPMPGTKLQILRLPLGGGEATTTDLQPVLPSASSRFGAKWAPNGRAVVFGSDESGKVASWVAEVRPDGQFGRPVQVRTSGLAAHGWGPDGQTLYVEDEHSRLHKITVTTEPQFAVSAPVEIADLEKLNIRMWAPIGNDRFIVNSRMNAYDDLGGLNIVQHFTEHLKQRVPAGK